MRRPAVRPSREVRLPAWLRARPAFDRSTLRPGAVWDTLRRATRWQLILMTAVSSGACGAGSTASSNVSATGSGSAVPVIATPRTTTLPTGCSDANPCTVAPGTYVLGPVAVIPGLTLTIPAGGWQTASGGADFGAFDLIPPGRPNDRLFIWRDLVAVKSTGSGHGTTVLTNVVTTPDGLITWLTSNHDVLVVSPPVPATFGTGIKSTTVVVGASPSAKYGDPACLSNPRCADLFTTQLWGKGNFFGVMGNEEVRLYLAAISEGGQPQTVFVAVDAPDGAADLATLSAAVAPIIASIHLPADAVAG